MVGTKIDGTLLDALRVFETVGMPARNFAVRTRREYSRDLRELLDYLATYGITDVDTVRLPHLEGYLAELDRRGLQGSSRNRKTHTIKSFFTWLVHHDLLITNPAVHLIPPRAIKRSRVSYPRRNTSDCFAPVVIIHGTLR